MPGRLVSVRLAGGGAHLVEEVLQAAVQLVLFIGGDPHVARQLVAWKPNKTGHQKRERMEEEKKR